MKNDNCDTKKEIVDESGHAILPGSFYCKKVSSVPAN